MHAQETALTHGTRERALGHAGELTQSPRELADDLDWPLRWDDARRRARASRRAKLLVDMEPLGFTDLECTYPGCTQAAQWRLTISGDDVAVTVESPRVCCTDHNARLTVPGGPF